MPAAIMVLMVEDTPDDAELQLAELRRAGFNPTWKRIQTESDFLAEIRQAPDIILCDYAMPEFSGLRAVQLLSASGLDIPFILVSGTVGEEVAVEAMRNGATDYLLKDRIARLGSAVERALSEKAMRTERRLVEASRDRLAAILEATPDMVSFSDPAGHILYFNRAGRSMLGLGPDEDLTGSSIGDLIPDPANNIILTEGVPAAIRDGTWSGETLLLSRRGRIIPVSQVILAHKSPEGTLEFLSTIMRDISARKRMEAAHARLALAVEQAAETIVITDTRGTIQYANPAFEKTSGYTTAEALGQNPRLLKSGKHDAEFYRQMWSVLRRGEVWRGHLINRRKDGKHYEEEATISPIRDAAGKVINYVAVNRDVTREVELESQFRQAQKMEAIGILAGGVAHDFNNILGVIQMQASLLQSEGGLSVEQTELAEDIGVAVQRAVGLTRQLLLFSRKEVLQLREVDLNHSVSEMTRMLTRILGESIAVQLKLAPEPMLLQADPGMMDQVLMNLAVNARDAMLGGGQLVIETSGVEVDEAAATHSANARPGSFVRLRVSDTGAGIAPEHLSRIFEPFFTTKGVGKGTGLGLSTVLGITQQHLGWVDVQSDVGHGATFMVYLPRLSEATNPSDLQQIPAAARTGNETVLLVEDEPAKRTMIRLTLERGGYRVMEASTGFEALDVWEEHHATIQLLLTDLMLPNGMSGGDLAQRLLHENPELKVVYMSGYSADVVGKDLSLREGVNFLAKPFQPEQLTRIIRQSLGAPATGA